MRERVIERQGEEGKKKSEENKSINISYIVITLELYVAN